MFAHNFFAFSNIRFLRFSSLNISHRELKIVSTKSSFVSFLSFVLLEDNFDFKSSNQFFHILSTIILHMSYAAFSCVSDVVLSQESSFSFHTRKLSFIDNIISAVFRLKAFSNLSIRFHQAFVILSDNL